jgi:oligopeptide transport system permease protein
MYRYIGKRILLSILTILVLITVVFTLVRLLPGDPFSDARMTEATRQRLLEYHGLDQPIHEQYTLFLKNLIVERDLGYSLRYSGRTVNSMIKDAYPVSVDLGIRALVFAVVGGLLLGIVAALNHNKRWDYSSMFIAVIGISIPSFIIGALIQYFFGVYLGWLPVAGWRTFSATLMPSFALGLYTLAVVARLMRANMLEVVNQDYIKTALSKGLSTSEIVFKHQIRNAVMPIITVLGPVAARLLTGAFVIEQVFNIPGLGRHYVVSIQNLDYTLTLGLTLFFGVFLIAINFLVDLSYGLVDPRIRIDK